MNLTGWSASRRSLNIDNEGATLLFTDAELVPAVTAALDELPETYRGRSVRFGWDDEPAQSRAEVTTVEDFVRAELGADVDPACALSTIDWLCAPQQRLLGLVRGEVYSDTDGRLARMRAAVRWIPPTCGCGWSAASGAGSPRRRPSSGGRQRWVTTSARR